MDMLFSLRSGQKPGDVPVPQSSPLEVRDLTVAYHRKPVLWSVDYTAPAARADRASSARMAPASPRFVKACLGLVPRFPAPSRSMAARLASAAR